MKPQKIYRIVGNDDRVEFIVAEEEKDARMEYESEISDDIDSITESTLKVWMSEEGPHHPSCESCKTCTDHYGCRYQDYMEERGYFVQYTSSNGNVCWYVDDPIYFRSEYQATKLSSFIKAEEAADIIIEKTMDEIKKKGQTEYLLDALDRAHGFKIVTCVNYGVKIL